MAQLRAIIEELLKPVSKGSSEEFAVWAFGDGFKDFEMAIEYMEAWNKLHGEDYLLNPHSYIEHDIPRMVELWKRA